MWIRILALLPSILIGQTTVNPSQIRNPSQINPAFFDCGPVPGGTRLNFDQMRTFGVSVSPDQSTLTVWTPVAITPPGTTVMIRTATPVSGTLEIRFNGLTPNFYAYQLGSAPFLITGRNWNFLNPPTPTSAPAPPIWPTIQGGPQAVSVPIANGLFGPPTAGNILTACDSYPAPVSLSQRSGISKPARTVQPQHKGK